MIREEELHDELLLKFREYFEANQVWLQKGTKRSGIILRQKLSEIREICSRRRIVVREWAIEKEAELAALEAQRQNQKQQGTKAGNDI
mgnify:CR=1 FL=1|jgi:hypothetical protein